MLYELVLNSFSSLLNNKIGSIRTSDNDPYKITLCSNYVVFLLFFQNKAVEYIVKWCLYLLSMNTIAIIHCSVSDTRHQWEPVNAVYTYYPLQGRTSRPSQFVLGYIVIKADDEASDLTSWENIAKIKCMHN